MAGADAPIAGMARFGSEALAAAGTSNLKLPRVYRVSGGEFDLDAARIGATVGDTKACLSQVYEIQYTSNEFSAVAWNCPNARRWLNW